MWGVCVNNQNRELTNGKIYQLSLEKDGEYFTAISDAGYTTSYYVTRFKIISFKQYIDAINYTAPSGN